MKIEYRSFIENKTMLPKPEVMVDEKLNLIAVSNAWGNNSNINNIFTDAVLDYYGSASLDSDATRPFPRIPTLSKDANNLRIAIILASQKIYAEFNDKEYNCGIETFVMAMAKQELIWFSTKGFCLILYKQDKVFPLQSNIPLLVQSNNKDKAAILPLELVGINRNEYIIPNSIKSTAMDKLVLLLKNNFEPKLMTLSASEISLDGVSGMLSSDAEHPFWLGIIQ